MLLRLFAEWYRKGMPQLRFLVPLAVAVFLAGCRTPTQEIEVRAVRPTSPNWEKEIAAFEAHDKTNPPPSNPIVFIGSSSIRMWKSLETDFPGKRVMNRGFGGSQIVDSVYYADRIVVPYRPRKIVLYAGGNDINAGKTAEEVFNDFRLFVETARQSLPGTQISYVSIAPNPARWSQIERVRAANRLIRDYCKRNRGLSYIDVHSHMLNEKKQPKEGIYLDDRLHMNEKGYKIWKEVIGPTLEK